MPRRRPNPKKKSARKQRETTNNASVDAWFETDTGQAFRATLELQSCCPELTTDALRRRMPSDESTNTWKFDLSGCSMTALPASIGSWKRTPKSLIELNLCRCTKLTALPEEIGELKTLERLDVRGCSSLVALPAAIGELSALRTLELDECSSLAALPATIGELKALTKLDLRECTGLAALPDAIGVLKALTQLDLYECSSLAALPDSIGKIGALTRLNLGGCVSLSYLPDTFGKLKALKNLNLAACTSLSALPDTMNGLEALEGLCLGGCSSLALSPDALDGLGALQVLLVSNCDKIGELSLAGLTNLEAINMENTPNIGFGTSTILMLYKQKVDLAGSDFSIWKRMRELRKQAKRRRDRRLCDFCGRQGGIDEPRLPVCYCGERRYCDETCQRAGWAAEHSETCLFGVFLTAEQIALLQRLEECYSHEMVTDVQYSHFREEYLKMTPAEAQDMFEKARQHMPDGFFSGGPCQWA